MRRALTLAIVASWAMMVALLLHKRVSPQASDVLALPGVEIGERDEWFAVYRDGQKVGHAHRVTARTTTGYRFFEDSVVALAMLGVPQTLRTSLVSETDPAFMLKTFRFTLASPATVFIASGGIAGDRLTVSYGPQGQPQTLELPLAEPIYLPSTLRPRVLAGERTPGTRYTVPVFSPLLLRNEPMTVIVEGRESVQGPDGPVETVRLAEEYQGMRTRAWLDDQGTVIREEAALGFTLERTTRTRALDQAVAAAPIDLATGSRIPLVGVIEEPRESARLSMRISGEGAGFVPDAPPRQHRTADLLRVTREDLPPEGTVALPIAVSGKQTGVHRGSADREPALAAFTIPAPFIESDDPILAGTARTIIGDTRDATTAARRLVSWVHDHIEKTPSVTVPSAREVLRERRGDCNEHAVLLTALARAVGLPARVVAGAVYANDGFYYHAWTELWLGSWVSADGVFGQMPVDATHVKLVDGGLERHIALAGVIGKLTFAVEEPPG